MKYVNLKGFSYVTLRMRQEGDSRPNNEQKAEVYLEEHPDLVLEDEPTTVRKLVELGLKVLQVHGFRLTGEKDYIPGTKEF
jgi:hypothetical protein